MHGKLQTLDLPLARAGRHQALAYSVLTDAQKKRFEETLELDFSFGIRGMARFRCNVFNQRGAVAAVYRVIPEQIKAFHELGLPPVIAQARRAAARPGARHRPDRQRQVDDAGRDDRQDQHASAASTSSRSRTRSSTSTSTRAASSTSARCTATRTGFATALRAALREDPDIVLIGELRDLETIESALRIAETGHLTFATLHTNSAAQTINRIIDVFPAHQQGQIRTQLSLVLEGIVCQALLPRADGTGRVVRARDPGADAGDQEPDSRRQGAPDLLDDADRAGEARDADDEPVAGDAVPEAADHARDGDVGARRLKDELEQMISRGAGVVAGRRAWRRGGSGAGADGDRNVTERATR